MRNFVPCSLAAVLLLSAFLAADTPAEMPAEQALQRIDGRSLQTLELAAPLSAEGLIPYRIFVDKDGGVSRLQRVGDIPASDFRDAADAFVPKWRFVPSSPWVAVVGVCYEKSLGRLLACVPASDQVQSRTAERLVIPGTQQNKQFSAPPLRKLKGATIERSGEARMARIQGVIQLNVGIDADGHVKEALAVHGHPMLMEQAIATVKGRKWEFAPIKFLGAPVEVRLALAVVLGPAD